MKRIDLGSPAPLLVFLIGALLMTIAVLGFYTYTAPAPGSRVIHVAAQPH